MLSRHTRLQELEPAQSQLPEPRSDYRKNTTQQLWRGLGERGCSFKQQQIEKNTSMLSDNK